MHAPICNNSKLVTTPASRQVNSALRAGKMPSSLLFQIPSRHEFDSQSRHYQLPYLDQQACCQSNQAICEEGLVQEAKHH